MSQTKVQLPFLAPYEYQTLMQALEFYHDNERAVAIDKETDLARKNKARFNATQAADLIKKLR